MAYDASDPRQVREKANLLRVTENMKADAIRDVMRTRSGRLWMHSLLEETHVLQSSFSTDALVMAFKEGERNIGLRLMALVVEAAPDDYAKMLKEAEEPLELEKLKGEEDGRTEFSDTRDET